MDPEALGRLTALGVRERLTLNCRNTRPIAQQTALVSDSKWRVKARIDGRPVDFTPYRQRSGWLNELDRLVTTLRRDNIPPGRISILLLKNPRPDEEAHLTRLALRRLTEDDVPHLGTAKGVRLIEDQELQRRTIEKTPAEDQLEQALVASSRIEFQTQTSFQAPPVSTESQPSEASDLGYPAWPSLEGLTGEKDQPKYAQKAHFIRHGAEEWPGGYLQSGRKDPLTPYEIKTGSVIPAVMISGINSDLPGQILAQVSEDIYDTATGRHLLIPQGSKVVGTYDNEVAFAQNRALVVWTKLIFPDASQVNLEGMPGADPSGYAGFRDKVNRHVGRRIGAALMLSVFNFAYEASRQQTQSSIGFQPQSAVTAAVGQSITELGRQMVEREMDVPNTLEIRPGYRFNVMVNKDIAFQSPYRRR